MLIENKIAEMEMDVILEKGAEEFLCLFFTVRLAANVS